LRAAGPECSRAKARQTIPRTTATRVSSGEGVVRVFLFVIGATFRRGLLLALLLATRDRAGSDREREAGDGAPVKPAAILLAGGPRALKVSDGRPVKIRECEKDSEAASGHLVGASRRTSHGLQGRGPDLRPHV